MTIESVRSQKSTAPSTVRFTTPPQSGRQQQPKKVAQSVAVPQHRSSPSIEQQTKVNKIPHKSLAVPIKPPDEEFEEYDYEAERTTQGVTETVIQLRMDNEEKQRQLIILQQRLVSFPLTFSFCCLCVNLESTT